VSNLMQIEISFMLGENPKTALENQHCLKEAPK
jgi:hypothetical protein